MLLELSAGLALSERFSSPPFGARAWASPLRGTCRGLLSDNSDWIREDRR
jgi:hypothetical protein